VFDGQAGGLFGPHCGAGVPGDAQHWVTLEPEAPPHVWLARSQHWHVGQSASEAHPPPDGVVVVVEPPGTVVVEPEPPGLPRLGGTADVAEPQHWTRPVSSHQRSQHVCRFRLQSRLARRTHAFRRFAGHVASRGSAATHAVSVSLRHCVRHGRHVFFGRFAASAGAAPAERDDGGEREEERAPRGVDDRDGARRSRRHARLLTRAPSHPQSGPRHGAGRRAPRDATAICAR
jgi:hypothetical protein